MAPHSSTLTWKIPWTEEPGRLQSMGSQRVGHDWATSLSLFTVMQWRRKWQPTPVFLPGESQRWGAWWAAVCGVAQSRTRLKWLSSSSSITVSQSLCFWEYLHFTFTFECSFAGYGILSWQLLSYPAAFWPLVFLMRFSHYLYCCSPIYD